MKLNTPFPFLLFFLLVFLGIYTCMSVKETKLEPNMISVKQINVMKNTTV